tara:strand:+ start:58383 stop:58709 length:327 start_codon:yes stop_codon:yes gene_type:complete
MLKKIALLSILASSSIQANEFENYFIDPSTQEAEAVCERFKTNAIPNALPDIVVLKTNYSSQTPVYVVSSEMAHGYACGYKVITKNNKTTDIRIEIDAKTGKSKLKKQ